jgi:hypothetical protein
MGCRVSAGQHQQGILSKMRKLRSAAIIGLAAASLIGLSSAWADPAGMRPGRCFNARAWNGWTVSPDGKSMYIRTGVSNIYRLDFANGCRAALGIGVHLVTRIRGSSFICSPLDLDLKVSDGLGFATPCLISSITPLSIDEAAALPKALKP